MVRTHRWHALVALPMLLLFPPPAAAQTGAVSGSVHSEGVPLASVQIEARSDGNVRRGTISDERGDFLLALPAGQYEIVFRLIGFAERRVEARVSPPQPTAPLDIEMTVQPLPLDEVLVTATGRAERAVDVPASVFVVDRREIEDQTAVTPLDHVVTTPGVDVAVQGLQARQLVARGFNSTLNSSLLMLTDYRNASLPSPRANLTYFMSVAESDLKRVEVVRGPSSALYGPNAADGVVHFVTRSPFESLGSTLALTGGGRSLFQAEGRHAAMLGENLAFKVSGSYFRGREFPAPPNPSEAYQPDPVTERASGELRADWRVTPTATAILTLGTAKAFRVLDYTAIGRYQVRNWRTDFAQLRFEDGRLFAQVYWNGNPGGGTSTSLQQGAVTLDHTNVLVAQVHHGFDFAGGHSLSYGLDFQRTDPQTLGTITGRNESDDRTVEIGGFVLGSATLAPGLEVFGAARLDHNDRLAGTLFSPRAGISFSPSEGHTFRASYNRAYATPNTPQLFADILAARLDPLPFSLRAVGVPSQGLRFPRSCGGPCVSSPFAPGQLLPLDATLLWPAVVQIMQGAGVDLSGIPAPTAADVGTVLRILDLSSGSFVAYTGGPEDLEPLRPTITSSFEVGYKGLFAGDRVLVDAAAYSMRRRDFIGPLTLVTPNVFLSTPALAAYLGRFMDPQQAGALAAGIGGLDGVAAAPGIPLATASPSGPYEGSDMLLTYQNVGNVSLWGMDLGVQVAPTNRLLLTGAYSYVNRNFFAASQPGDPDISTNAPRNKAMLSGRFGAPSSDRFVEVRGRFVGRFRMVDGILIGDVDGFAVADVEAGTGLPGIPGARLKLTVSNVTDSRHAEFFGHPELGRLLMTRLEVRF